MGIKPLLVQLLKQAPLICAIIKTFQAAIPENTERTAKRQKADVRPMVDQVDSLSKLTFLAEVMSAQELPGSLDLISALLESLARILDSVATTRPELIYIEQLFMTCIDSVASQIKVRHFAFQR